MCFVKKHIKHLVLDSDIICYKIAWETSTPDIVNSRFFEFEYQIGNPYSETNVSLEHLDERVTLDGGVFHSYWALTDNIKNRVKTYNHKGKEYGWSDRLCIIECCIPAGTPYWTNDVVCEYASTAIKILRKVDLNEQ